MNASPISRLQTPDAWQGIENAADICADRLRRGRLVLVLGAGASVGFGLPSWPDLISGLFEGTDPRIVRPEGLTDTAAAELVWSGSCGSDDVRFAGLVQRVLYRGYSFDFSSLQANNLLAAIGALTIASTRGRLAHVVTFNFDTVLETYLSYLGLVTASISRVPTWGSRADAVVLHPHGLLPAAGPATEGIVFTGRDFDRVVGDAKDHWHAQLSSILSSHTCLFIGLSGNDPNLSSLLLATAKHHVGSTEREAFWGYALMRRPAKNAFFWDNRRICPLEFDGFDEYPAFLFDICQRAAVAERDR